MTQRIQNPQMSPPESPSLSVRVRPETAAWLREEADRQRRTVSQLVNLILTDYVAAQQQAAEKKRPKG